ncbi:hypothetical protein DERF_012397 [Dermatophagoides farinae]|uniref:Uncharacterized protein n=1 Tax=Dermatophagoides farinae TaxID=6954 RepID=A0A922KYA7_DERFA|nr:hypothetical protein DERF_012397 [Dermatophagoides farinae]
MITIYIRKMSYQIKIRSNYRNDDFPVILYIGSWAFKVLKYQLLLLLKPMYYIVVSLVFYVGLAYFSKQKSVFLNHRVTINIRQDNQYKIITEIPDISGLNPDVW